MRPHSTGWLAVGIASFLIGEFSAAAQTPAQAGNEERIKILEDRVAQLENTIRLLLEQKAPASQPAPLPVTYISPVGSQRREMPPELLPEIGKIGAEVGLLIGGSTSPFGLDRGSSVAGFIDLPLFDQPSWLRGKVSYEILVGLSQSSTTLSSTSNVAQVANLAVLSALNPAAGAANIGAAVTGTGPAPFPVTTTGVTRFRLLQVVPFALKYTSRALDRWNFRPYGVLGFGTYVTIHNQNPGRGPTPSSGVRANADLPAPVLSAIQELFGGRAPFGGPLVAGQISQSPELEARGLPGGHGNFDLGVHSGAGLEYRLSPLFSLGFDARYNRIAGTHGGFKTFSSRVGFHF